jgi:hypothetical protein
MNLIDANPELKSPAKLREWVYQSVKESSAIEGIRHPFAKGKRFRWHASMEDLVKYWKKRVARDHQLRRKKASRAARSRDSSLRG